MRDQCTGPARQPSGEAIRCTRGSVSALSNHVGTEEGTRDTSWFVNVSDMRRVTGGAEYMRDSEATAGRVVSEARIVKSRDAQSDAGYMPDCEAIACCIDAKREHV